MSENVLMYWIDNIFFAEDSNLQIGTSPSALLDVKSCKFLGPPHWLDGCITRAKPYCQQCSAEWFWGTIGVLWPQ